MIVPNFSTHKAYQIVAPVSTHFRKATCKEVECRGYVNGWVTRVLPDSPQALYIRAHSGRRFIESRNEDGTASFTFPPGQMCFRASDHHVSLEREPIYVVRDRDAVSRRESHNWVDDFATHQQSLRDALERG